MKTIHFLLLLTLSLAISSCDRADPYKKQETKLPYVQDPIPTADTEGK